MKCPRCEGADSRVVDSRTGKNGESIRRRRECSGCGLRFTTYERVEVTIPAIVKSDGRREDYDRGKIVAGISRACEKRPISVDDQSAVVDRIEKKLAAALEREVSSKAVGDLVMEELKTLDGVAYLRFASVYQSFQDISDFLAEAQAVARNQSGGGSEEE